MSETLYTESRPQGWSLADEGYVRVTRIDYFGVPYTVWQKKTKSLDYSALWKSFNHNKQWQGSGSVSESWEERELLKQQIKEGSI